MKFVNVNNTFTKLVSVRVLQSSFKVLTRQCNISNHVLTQKCVSMWCSDRLYRVQLMSNNQILFHILGNDCYTLLHFRHYVDSFTYDFGTYSLQFNVKVLFLADHHTVTLS